MSYFTFQGRCYGIGPEPLTDSHAREYMKTGFLGKSARGFRVVLCGEEIVTHNLWETTAPDGETIPEAEMLVSLGRDEDWAAWERAFQRIARQLAEAKAADPELNEYAWLRRQSPFPADSTCYWKDLVVAEARALQVTA